MYCSKCGSEIADGSLFCHHCGNKISTETLAKTDLRNNEILIESSKIKEYLGYAKFLEVSKFTLYTAKNKLQQKIDSLGRYRNFEKPTSDVSNSFDGFWRNFFILLILGLIIASICCAGEDGDPIVNLLSILLIVTLFTDIDLLIGVGISIGAALVGAFIIAIIKSINYSAKYNKKLNEYKRKIENDKDRVKEEKIQINILKEEQAELNQQISVIDNTLERLYSLNVVYPKYRSLIPIVTIHEYFDSGRHSSLPEAYNKYEEESRQNRIIEQLDVVISMLEQIRNNQYALYEAIQESNEIADRIYYQSEKMLSSNRKIAHNSEIAAYNAKIAAENSTISTYIDYCKW